MKFSSIVAVCLATILSSVNGEEDYSGGYGSYSSIYGSNAYADSSSTYYDGYAQAWRYLGWYVDCNGGSNRYYGGSDSHSHSGSGDEQESYGNNFCQRYLMWAAYVDESYSGGGIGEYAIFDTSNGYYDYTACESNGNGNCKLMDCHDTSSDSWKLLGVFKEASYFGNDAFFEQLFKHEGVCVWNDEDLYDFMSETRESSFSSGCLETGISDGYNSLYIDLKPTFNGNMTYSLYTDYICSSEYEGYDYNVESVAANMGLLYGSYMEAWNDAMEPFKVCQPCRAYNLQNSYSSGSYGYNKYNNNNNNNNNNNKMRTGTLQRKLLTVFVTVTLFSGLVLASTIENTPSTSTTMITTSRRLEETETETEPPPKEKIRFATTHKMGHMLTWRFKRQYIKNRGTGFVPRIPPTVKMRKVVVVRDMFDATVSGYLYHLEGKECWRDHNGKEIPGGIGPMSLHNWTEVVTTVPILPESVYNYSAYPICEAIKAVNETIGMGLYLEWARKEYYTTLAELNNKTEDPAIYVCMEDMKDRGPETSQRILDFYDGNYTERYKYDQHGNVMYGSGELDNENKEEANPKKKTKKAKKGKRDPHASNPDPLLRERLYKIARDLDCKYFGCETKIWNDGVRCPSVINPNGTLYPEDNHGDDENPMTADIAVPTESITVTTTSTSNIGADTHSQETRTVVTKHKDNTIQEEEEYSMDNDMTEMIKIGQQFQFFGGFLALVLVIWVCNRQSANPIRTSRAKRRLPN